jgi:membrane fusion protein, multidrug efflux system
VAVGGNGGGEAPDTPLRIDDLGCQPQRPRFGADATRIMKPLDSPGPKMSTSRRMRWPFALPVTLALSGAFLPLSCSRSAADRPRRTAEDGVPVTVARVETVPLDRTLAVVGSLFAKDEATLGAQVEGRVERTLVDFGDRVTAGQDLALIDTTSYEALARQAAANVARAQAGVINAEQNLKRIRELQRDQVSSASELDLATAQAEQARADLKAVEAADAIARLNLDRSHVKAAFDGAVAERIASAGDYLKVGSPLFRVVNDAVLKFIVQVPERYAARVQKEQRIRFNVDAWPGVDFEGGVYLISPSVNTTTRAFNVGALVPNPEQKLKANTFARGELLLERQVPTPVVPLDAVVNFAGVTKVFLVENGVARSRAVEVGRVQAGRQEILAGLKPDETVVLSGQTKLYDGARVRLKDAAPPPPAS